MWWVTCTELDLRPFSGLTASLFNSSLVVTEKDRLSYESLVSPPLQLCSSYVPPVIALRARGVLACRACCCIFSGLLFVTSGSAVIDYEIQRRAFGRHTSPLARYLTTIDFLGPCLRRRIKSGCHPLDTKPC